MWTSALSADCAPQSVHLTGDCSTPACQSSKPPGHLTQTGSPPYCPHLQSAPQTPALRLTGGLSYFSAVSQWLKWAVYPRCYYFIFHGVISFVTS